MKLRDLLRGSADRGLVSGSADQETAADRACGKAPLITEVAEHKEFAEVRSNGTQPCFRRLVRSLLPGLPHAISVGLLLPATSDFSLPRHASESRSGR